MDEITRHLRQLEEPDLGGPGRVWDRYQRARRPSRARLALPVGALLLAASCLLLPRWMPEERTRTLQVEDAGTVAERVWSDQIALETSGAGRFVGTAKDLDIHWSRGRFQAAVTPNSGTSVIVRTDEALVEVVGTIFTVERDRLGSTVSVEKGRVRVDCRDGWSGMIGADDPPHTCLPASAALLLGRADALIDTGASADVLMGTLDRGIAAAEDPTVLGELLVRRMRLHAEDGAVDAALADAGRYLEIAAGRTEEVQRFAGWLALSERGCDQALDWLVALHERGHARETVLYAECLAERDPQKARRLILGALPSLDDEWTHRATLDLAVLPWETR